jgi:hypothetical protein
MYEFLCVNDSAYVHSTPDTYMKYTCNNLTEQALELCMQLTIAVLLIGVMLNCCTDNGGAASGLSLRKELSVVTYAFGKKAQKALKTTRRMELAIPQVSTAYSFLYMYNMYCSCIVSLSCQLRYLCTSSLSVVYMPENCACYVRALSLLRIIRCTYRMRTVLQL